MYLKFLKTVKNKKFNKEWLKNVKYKCIDSDNQMYYLTIVDDVKVGVSKRKNNKDYIVGYYEI